MKPFLCFLLFCFCFSNNVISQQCTLSTDTAHLDVNNARVILQASGDFFWDRNDAGFFVPKNDPSQPQTATIFAGGLWLGGFDANGNFKTAAQTYGANGGDTDYWSGPLNAQGVTNGNICNDFDKLWKVLRSEINSHIADFANDGDIDGPVPQSILEWPGRDNPQSLSANGFELPQGQVLAPFVDRNSNGEYEPMLGDYPDVKGDQAIWWVFNDQGGGAVHGETHGQPMNVEIHALAYGFSGQNDEDLENTTFYEFEVLNKRSENLDSAYIGLWLDTDIGCASDDFVGCISSEKIAFAYNADSSDGDISCACSSFGVLSYCQDIPVTAVKVLNSPTGTGGVDVGFSGFSIAANEFPGAYPFTELNPYSAMAGLWGDGTPITYGGSGYDTSSNQYHHFLMDGNPGIPSDWSFCTEDFPPKNFSILISSGTFSLAPGEGVSITFAIMNKFGLSQPCPELTPIIQMGNHIQTVFDQLSPTKEPYHNPTITHFYPNPLISEGTLTSTGAPLAEVRLYDVSGQLVNVYKDLRSNELSIKRGGLSAGFYSYQALLADGQLAAGRIIMQ